MLNQSPNVLLVLSETLADHFEREYPLRASKNYHWNPIKSPRLAYLPKYPIVVLWYGEDEDAVPYASLEFLEQHIVVNSGPRYGDNWRGSIIVEYAHPQMLEQIDSILTKIEL